MAGNKPVSLALVGAGARGELNLATLAKKHDDLMKFVAVAEADDKRRESFARQFNIPEQNCFQDWRALYEKPRLADAVINALPCRMHFESCMGGLERGYHTFLEKPMALTPGQCVRLTREAKDRALLLMVALQSRYNTIYTKMRNRFDEGTVGQLMNIDCAENIGYWHFLLSYVRGIHRKRDLSHSFLMAKAIHDLDLVCWFANASPRRVSSFGSLSYFNEENAPPGAPERCMDGCPVFDTCEFNAYKQFVDPGQPDIPWSLLSGMSAGAVKDYITNPRFRSLASVISLDMKKEAVLDVMKNSSYGRCAFHADNDVVDHQTVSVEFENRVVASFSLSAFSLIWERTLNLHGTKGEIRSADFTGRLEERSFNPGRVKKQRVRYHGVVHGGGDETILVRFAEALKNDDESQILTAGPQALVSHLLCFAAEQAREQGVVVEMDAFTRQAELEADSV